MNNADTYQKLSLRTESLPSPAVVKGRDPNNLLRDALGSIGKLSEEVDKLKKLLFYGKNPTSAIELPKEETLETPALTEKNLRLVHTILGIQSELGEVIEALGLGDVKLGDELGDVQWYLSVGLDAVDIPLSRAMAANIEKLRVRFPDKFSESGAIFKDDSAEMEATRRHINPTTEG